MLFRSERIPEDHMNVYVAVPAASGSVLAEMDPRMDEQWVEDHRPHPEPTT